MFVLNLYIAFQPECVCKREKYGGSCVGWRETSLSREKIKCIVQMENNNIRVSLSTAIGMRFFPQSCWYQIHCVLDWENLTDSYVGESGKRQISSRNDRLGTRPSVGWQVGDNKEMKEVRDNKEMKEVRCLCRPQWEWVGRGLGTGSRWTAVERSWWRTNYMEIINIYV